MPRKLVPCKDGWDRNPDTNRCRKIRAEGEAVRAPRKKRPLKPCKPGQERNPATNRCRKIKPEGVAERAPRKRVVEKKPEEFEVQQVRKSKLAPRKAQSVEIQKPVVQEIKQLKKMKQLLPKTKDSAMKELDAIINSMMAKALMEADAPPDPEKVERRKPISDKRRKDMLMKRAGEIPDYHRALEDPDLLVDDWQSVNLVAVNDISEALDKIDDEIPVSEPSEIQTQIANLSEAVERVRRSAEKGISLADMKKRKEMLDAIEFHNQQFMLPGFDMPAENAVIMMGDIEDRLEDILEIPVSEPSEIQTQIANLSEAVDYVREQNKKGISLAQLKLRKSKQLPQAYSDMF